MAARRRPTDVVLFYTGGTTGLPKGVVWQQDELFHAETADLEALDGAAPGDVGIVTRKLHAAGAVSLPASPLMHGTGFYSQLGVLSFGGAVVTLESRSFDPVELFDAVERERVEKLVIVGDVFARPMLEALDREPDRWNISSLQMIVSSGAIWSEETKRRLLAYNPSLTLWDSLGSSEAFGLARSISTRDHIASTGRSSRRPTSGCSTRWARVSPRDRRHWPAGRSRPESSRLPQRSRRQRRRFRRFWWRPLCRVGRLGADRSGWDVDPSRSRRCVHQHRRRVGLSRRGRDGDPRAELGQGLRRGGGS